MPPATAMTTLAAHIPQVTPSRVTNGSRNTGYPGRASKIRRNRVELNGAVCPPVCPARRRAFTSRHAVARHSAVTRRPGSGAWKRTTSTRWWRRAVDASPAQA